MDTTRDALAGDPKAREFLSPEGLAEYLGIPVATIYQWRHKGYGPPVVKIGRHLRYRRTGVDAWISEQEKFVA